MSKAEPAEIQYWDACLFIWLLAGQDQDRDEIAKLRLLAQRAKDGHITIVTSMLSVAEVRPAKDRPISADELDKVNSIMLAEEIDLRPMTLAIAQRAQAIGHKLPDLLPADCVHVATALEANAAVLFTYDGCGKRRRPSHMIYHSESDVIAGLKICTPFVAHGPLFDTDQSARGQAAS